jgi:hypothetical protein
MTPTPRTDAIFEPIYQPPWRVGLKNLVKLLFFCRELEQELHASQQREAALRQASDELKCALETFQNALEDGPENCSYMAYGVASERAESAIANYAALYPESK